MPTTSIFRDPLFRGKVLLSSELIKTLNTRKVSLEELMGIDKENPLYIVIEGANKKRILLFAYNNNVLDCIDEDQKNKSMESCLEDLTKLLFDENIPKRVMVQKFPLKLIENTPIIKELDKKTPNISETIKISIGEKTREVTLSKTQNIPSKIREEFIRSITLTDLGQLEYLISNELTKLGYIIDTVSIVKFGKDYIVNINLSKMSELPSTKDLSYIVAGMICENIPIEKDIIVNISHKRKYKEHLSFNGDKTTCLALGTIPRILKDYGLIIKNLDYRMDAETFTLRLDLKKYSYELNHDPEDILYKIYSSLSEFIKDKKIKLIIKFGLFGKTYSM